MSKRGKRDLAIVLVVVAGLISTWGAHFRFTSWGFYLTVASVPVGLAGVVLYVRNR